MPQTRQLAAMFTNIVGYTALMGEVCKNVLVAWENGCYKAGVKTKEQVIS